MTPLWGTKTSSTPIGAKSGGDGRAARSLLSCALWSGMGRLWRGMGGRRPPRRQHGLLGFHQPRGTQHGFPRPSGDSKESNPKPDQRVFTKHETRVTKHGFFHRACARDTQSETTVRTAAHAARSLLSCALWSGMGRLWRGMGGRRPPHRQHALLGFHQPRGTQHGFPRPSGDSKESNPKPDQRVFHESRDTNHESRLFFESRLPYPRFPTISHHFPAFPGPPTPLRCSRSASRRAPSAAAPAALRARSSAADTQ